MAEIYGHAWVSQYGAEADAGSMWAASISGLSMDQLSVGIKRFALTSEAFPPTTGEFRAACLGVPSLLSVKAEIANGERSPFTRLVMATMDMYAYRNADADKAHRMLRESYGEVRNDVMLGKPLPDTHVELPHVEQPFVPASPETAAKAMADIEKALGV